MQSKLPDTAKILFISDAHLGGFSSKKNKRIETELIELLDFAREHHFKIAVLGDLFDYWMEYDDYIPPVGRKLLTRFAAFNQNHTTLYITGNHDNWTQGHFAELGFDVEPNYRLLTVGNKNVLLLHGDATGNDLENLSRPLLHQILRNKWFVKLYKTFYFKPSVGINVMKKYSRFTSTLKAGKTNPAPLNKWSKKMLQTSNIDFIICGHDHVPRVRQHRDGTYLNLGTFHHHKTLVTYNNKQFKLVCWNSYKQKLTPFTSPKIDV